MSHEVLPAAEAVAIALLWVLVKRAILLGRQPQKIRTTEQNGCEQTDNSTHECLRNALLAFWQG
jgi:hypothetical protein